MHLYSVGVLTRACLAPSPDVARRDRYFVYDRRAPECGEFTLTSEGVATRGLSRAAPVVDGLSLPVRRLAGTGRNAPPRAARGAGAPAGRRGAGPAPGPNGIPLRKACQSRWGHLSYSVVRLAIYPLYRTRIPREHQRQRVTPIAVR